MPSTSTESTCPGEEDIAAFVQGCLAPPYRRTLEAHFARCSACRRLLSALARAAATESAPADNSAAPTLPLERAVGDTGLQRGTRFGRYVVLDWLGAGGMGVVYAAYDSELNRKVALKVLGNGGAGSAEPSPIHDLLLREAQAMAQLAHPNVVTVFDVGSIGDRVFIAMELVDGLTLARWLVTERRERTEIIAMFVAAGHGLAAAHDAGLIHRDFKPDNVLIGHDGRVRVTDFGLARPAPGAPVQATRSATEQSERVSAPQSGLAGTLAYMAPEQYLGKCADARADQFSFAVALYEALCGERPFAALELSTGNPADIRGAAASPRSGGVPAALRQVLARALSTEPDARYPSMRELLAALAPRLRRGRAIAIAASVMVIIAFVSAGSYAIHLRHAAARRTELVGRLRGLAPELRTLLRSAHMLPMHDIRTTREQVRSAMRDIERQLQTPSGQEEIALIDLVLGEGHQALGDHERSLALLEAAWAAGERGPHIHAVLGRALGDTYEGRLELLEQTVPSAERETQIRRLEERYRDPAMIHLRAALAARASSPSYLEALISFHDHHFAESARTAHAAFTESPTSYEAGMLEARAHSEAALKLLAADKPDEAKAAFATARRTFERVLEIARSDDEAWLEYADMVLAQANALADGELPADLRQHVITALHNVRQINPDSWKAWSREAEIYEKEANYAIIAGRDPGADVEKVLALAGEARARGADGDQIDIDVCLAQWERAVYQGAHGSDPHAAFGQAISACRSAAAAKPEPDKYISLGVVYLSLASYEGEHGTDSTKIFELGELNFRSALSIDDNALTRYSLGRLWTKLAQYQVSHGRSPQAAVDHALTEYSAAIRMDATRRDAWAGMSDALTARARFLREAQEDARPTLERAHEALERALVTDANFVPAIRSRLAISELDAAVLLERNADPTAAVVHMRADAQKLLQHLPDDGFAHRQWCQAELIAARWALVQHQAVGPLLARAAIEAARARTADPMDALAWAVSAEVEQVRVDAARMRGSAASAAIASRLAFIEHALKIDPGLLRTDKARAALAR